MHPIPGTHVAVSGTPIWDRCGEKRLLDRKEGGFANHLARELPNGQQLGAREG